MSPTAKSLQGQIWNSLTLEQRKDFLSRLFKTKLIVEKHANKLYHKLPKAVKKSFTKKLRESII